MCETFTIFEDISLNIIIKIPLIALDCIFNSFSSFYRPLNNCSFNIFLNIRLYCKRFSLEFKDFCFMFILITILINTHLNNICMRLKRFLLICWRSFFIFDIDCFILLIYYVCFVLKDVSFFINLSLYYLSFFSYHSFLIFNYICLYNRHFSTFCL